MAFIGEALKRHGGKGGRTKMGVWVKVAAWVIGLMAIVIASVLVLGALYGGGDRPSLAGAPPERPCPPRITAPARAPGAPVDDLLTIRPGYSVGDVQRTLFCRDEAFAYQFEPIWHTRVPAGTPSRQRMAAVRKAERLTFGLVGEKDGEVVYAMWQEIGFGEADPTPTPEAMAKDLTAHYGTPHETKQARNRLEVSWLYGPDGKPLKTEITQGADPFSALGGWIAGAWSFSGCAKHAKVDPLAQPSWSAECGVTIRAEIDRRPEDPMRVLRYRIVALDQARLAAAVDSYRAARGGAPHATR